MSTTTRRPGTITTPIERAYVVTVHDPDAALTETFETWQANKVDAVDVARHIYGPCFGPRTTYEATRKVR